MLTEEEKRKLKNAAKTAAEVGLTCVVFGGILAFKGAKKLYKFATKPPKPQPEGRVTCSQLYESVGVMGIERISGCSSEGVSKCGRCGGHFCAKHIGSHDNCAPSNAELDYLDDPEETSRVLSQWYQN